MKFSQTCIEEQVSNANLHLIFQGMFCVTIQTPQGNLGRCGYDKTDSNTMKRFFSAKENQIKTFSFLYEMLHRMRRRETQPICGRSPTYTHVVIWARLGRAKPGALAIVWTNYTYITSIPYSNPAGLRIFYHLIQAHPKARCAQICHGLARAMTTPTLVARALKFVSCPVEKKKREINK